MGWFQATPAHHKKYVDECPDKYQNASFWKNIGYHQGQSGNKQFVCSSGGPVDHAKDSSLAMLMINKTHGTGGAKIHRITDVVRSNVTVE